MKIKTSRLSQALIINWPDFISQHNEVPFGVHDVMKDVKELTHSLVGIHFTPYHYLGSILYFFAVSTRIFYPVMAVSRSLEKLETRICKAMSSILQ